MEAYNVGSEVCNICEREKIVLDHKMQMCLDCADVGEDATPERGES